MGVSLISLIKAAADSGASDAEMRTIDSIVHDDSEDWTEESQKLVLRRMLELLGRERMQQLLRKAESESESEELGDKDALLQRANYEALSRDVRVKPIEMMARALSDNLDSSKQPGLHAAFAEYRRQGSRAAFLSQLRLLMGEEWYSKAAMQVRVEVDSEQEMCTFLGATRDSVKLTSRALHEARPVTATDRFEVNIDSLDPMGLASECRDLPVLNDTVVEQLRALDERYRDVFHADGCAPEDEDGPPAATPSALESRATRYRRDLHALLGSDTLGLILARRKLRAERFCAEEADDVYVSDGARPQPPEPPQEKPAEEATLATELAAYLREKHPVPEAASKPEERVATKPSVLMLDSTVQGRWKFDRPFPHKVVGLGTWVFPQLNNAYAADAWKSMTRTAKDLDSLDTQTYEQRGKWREDLRWMLTHSPLAIASSKELVVLALLPLSPSVPLFYEALQAGQRNPNEEETELIHTGGPKDPRYMSIRNAGIVAVFIAICRRCDDLKRVPTSESEKGCAALAKQMVDAAGSKFWLQRKQLHVMLRSLRATIEAVLGGFKDNVLPSSPQQVIRKSAAAAAETREHGEPARRDVKRKHPETVAAGVDAQVAVAGVQVAEPCARAAKMQTVERGRRMMLVSKMRKYVVARRAEAQLARAEADLVIAELARIDGDVDLPVAQDVLALVE